MKTILLISIFITLIIMFISYKLGKTFRNVCKETKNSRVKTLASILSTTNYMSLIIGLCFCTYIVASYILYPEALHLHNTILLNFFIVLMFLFERLLMFFVVEVRNGWHSWVEILHHLKKSH